MEIGAAIAASLDGHTIIQRVTDAATALAGADVGVFVSNLVEPASASAFRTYSRTRASGGTSRPCPPPGIAETLGPALLENVPVRAPDVTTEGRFGHAPLAGFPDGAAPVRSVLLVPIKSGAGERLGALWLGHGQPAWFTAQHETMAIGLASWASLALENSRLYVAARDAGRLRDEFLAVLSHELRTPLNAILGYTGLLRGGMLEGHKVDHAMETLERNAKALAQIVDDVLDVSRILAPGKLRLDVQTVELPLIVHTAIATVQPASDAKGVHVHARVEPGAATVAGDPNRLQQVVWNLLTNAVKFTPRDGAVHVHVSRLGPFVCIEVRDSGVGISPEFLPHVFDRFRQADTGTTRKTGGLGIGLSIVRHIVEMHGGSVEVSSEGEGLGTTVRIMLPAAAMAASERHEAADDSRPGRLAALARVANLQGVRVLAVDDDADALALVQLVLESAGAIVTAIASAPRALERLDGVRPDAMVVDLAMPEMDG